VDRIILKGKHILNFLEMVEQVAGEPVRTFGDEFMEAEFVFYVVEQDMGRGMGVSVASADLRWLPCPGGNRL